MLTAKTQCSDVKRGFAVGADNYVKKPFSNEELLARIDYLLNRNKNHDAKTQSTNIKEYKDGALKVNFVAKQVFLHDQEVCLTSTEYKLLEFLTKHPHKTLTTRTLLTEVWGDAYSHDKTLLSFYIHQLRKKLKEGGGKSNIFKHNGGKDTRVNPLPPPQAPTTETTNTEQKKEPKKIFSSFIYKWAWLPLAGLVFLLGLVMVQNDISLALSTNSNDRHTSIEANITAEGFVETDLSGLRGQICVNNTGKYPTENLSIVNTVHVYNKSKVRYISSTLDISKKPILSSGESHCYPFGIGFEPNSGDELQFQITTMITITNHTGLLPDSKYCPGTDPCPYGPEITTDFTLLEP